jgi:tetratricopeptide (TPR) repeat protein
MLQTKLHRAVALFRQGEMGGARALCEEILKAQPEHYTSLNLLGMIAARTGDPTRALVLFGKAIAADPQRSPAHCNRGVTLLELGDVPGALASLEQATRLNPQDAEAHLNKGNALRASWQLEAALESYERALALKPDFVEAHTNRGVALVQLARYEDAGASFERAIALRPEHASAVFNRGLLRLLLGDFERGWPDYEWRFRVGAMSGALGRYGPRLWSGSGSGSEERLEGRRILLYGEQGFGDTIQFARYIEKVAALGADVTLEVQPQLAVLLRSQGLHGVSAVVEAGEAVPAAHDYHSPLMSLPRAFGTRLTSIPGAAVPYLRSDPMRVARWQERLGARTRPRIGLAWSGRATHWNDRNRTLSLAEWLAHLPPGFQYVSLQKEVRETDRTTLRANPHIMDVARELGDFADTAALCDCLDLIISVDSSVAHLGGALGKRTWILVPFNPDWRWLLGRDDSPWYPTATLYRQKGMGEWREVLERVGAELILSHRR